MNEQNTAFQTTQPVYGPNTKKDLLHLICCCANSNNNEVYTAAIKLFDDNYDQVEAGTRYANQLAELKIAKVNELTSLIYPPYEPSIALGAVDEMACLIITMIPGAQKSYVCPEDPEEPLANIEAYADEDLIAPYALENRIQAFDSSLQLSLPDPEENDSPEVRTLNIKLADKRLDTYILVKHFEGDTDIQLQALNTYLANQIIESRIYPGMDGEVSNYDPEVLAEMLDISHKKALTLIEVTCDKESLTVTFDGEYVNENDTLYQVSKEQGKVSLCLPIALAYLPVQEDPEYRDYSEKVKEALKDSALNKDELADKLNFMPYSREYTSLLKRLVNDQVIVSDKEKDVYNLK